MAKIPVEDLDKYTEDSVRVVKFKKKPQSDPNKKHNKTKKRHLEED